MERLDRVIFYSLDKSIKTYRQFAQKRFFEQGLDITVDQWLVLNAIYEKPDITQLDIAGKVFKDTASVTRIIELLIKKGFLKREAHSNDRRRFTLELTTEGQTLMNKITDVVEQNRAIALQGISEKDLFQMKETLNHIINNCKNVL